MKTFLCTFVITLAVSQFALAGRHHGGMGGGMGKCCKAPSSDGENETKEKFKGFMKECHEENKNGEQEGGPPHGKMACMAECVGKKMNVVNSDGSLNEAEFRKQVSSQADADYKKTVADTVATTCFNEAKDAPKINGCGTAAGKAAMCVGREFFKACPVDMQDTSEQCAGIRKMVESGQMPGPRGPK